MLKRYLRAAGFLVGLGLLTTACEKNTVAPEGQEGPTAARTAVAATRDNNLAMGNPSGAVASTGSPTNYLQDCAGMYYISYNNTLKRPNWVSWHLSSAWKGTATRSTSFIQDPLLPTGWYRVSTDDYTGSGFDRGHMCPSDDRDFSSTADQPHYAVG